MGSDQNLDLIIQADSKGVQTGMVDAQNSVVTAVNEITKSTSDLANNTKTSTDQVSESWKKMASDCSEAMKTSLADTTDVSKKMSEAMSSSVADIKKSFGTLGDAAGLVSRHFGAIAAIFAGAGIFKEGISETKELTTEAIALSKSLSMSATAASDYNVGLKLVGVSSGEVTSIASRVTRALKTNEEGMNAVGLVTRDTSGHLLNQKELLANLTSTLNSFKEGTDRNTAAQYLFRGGVEEVAALTKIASINTEEATKRAKELGLQLSEGNVAATKEYKLATNDLNLSLEAIKNAIGEQVMPVFTEMTHWLSAIAPAAVKMTSVAFEMLADTFWAVRNGVVILTETIIAMVKTVGEPVRAMVAAAYKAATGDFSGAQAELGGIGDNIKRSWSDAMDAMLKSSEKTVKAIKATFDNVEGTGKDITYKKPEGKDFENPKQKSSGDSQMKGFEAELAEMKMNFQEEQRLQGSFIEFSKRQELQFWQEKLSSVQKGSDEYNAIRLKSANLALALDKQGFEVEMQGLKNRETEYKHNMNAKLAIAEEYAQKMKTAYGEDSKQYQSAQQQIVMIKRQSVQQLKQIQDESDKLEMERSLSIIESEKQEAQFRVQLGTETKEKELVEEAGFENRIYEIRRAAMDKKMAIAEDDKDRDPVAIAKIYGQIEQLEMQHNQKLKTLENQKTLESNKQWTGLFSSIQNSMSSVLQKVMTGTMSIGNALKSFMLSIGQAIIGLIADVIAKWVMAQATEILLGKTAAAAIIPANASVAATGAMASVASIPYVGWAMAPEVGAETYASAMAYEALASAEDGMIVPQGTNPITQLHEKEMVLPAGPSKMFQDMADNGGATQKSEVHFHVHTMDAGGVKSFLRQNAHVMAPGLGKLARNFTGR